MNMFFPTLILVPLMILLVACSSSGSTPAPTVTLVAISASENELTVGETLQLSASVQGEYNPPQTVTWSSNREIVARVHQNGLVTAVAALAARAPAETMLTSLTWTSGKAGT